MNLKEINFSSLNVFFFVFVFSRKTFETGSANTFLERIPLVARLDYQQDKSLAAANVDIKNTKQTVR